MTIAIRVLEWYVTLPDWAYPVVVAVVGIAVMGGIVGLRWLYGHLRWGP